MAKYVADALYIASIYPGVLEPIRRNYGASVVNSGPKASRSTLFKLQPVKRGKKPFVLEVLDSFETAINVMDKKQPNTKPVECQHIVNDLIGNWAGNTIGVPQGAKRGIMQIVGTVPTEAEKQQMETEQTAYFEYWFAQGEALSRGDPQAIRNFTQYTPEMMLAAEWLGEDRRWSNPAIMRDTAPCPWCGTQSPIAYPICGSCNRDKTKAPELVGAKA